MKRPYVLITGGCGFIGTNVADRILKSGRPVVLQGSAGLLITMHGADNHTQYTGAVDFKTGYPVLLESQQVQDFEGVVQWGLGLSRGACYRAFLLQSPLRLVVDFSTA